MNWRKFSPVILTLLVFLLSQGLGTLLLFIVGMLTSPEFNTSLQAYISGEAQSLPLLELIPISVFSICTAAADLIAVMICYLLLHNIRLDTAFEASSINWRTGMLAIAGGILGAFATSIMTEGVALPDVMVQLSLEMSNDIWGILTLAIIGPVAEELLFREAIEGEMLRRGTRPWTAIIVSALAFSIAHLNLAQGLYALPLAILFGIIYYKTGNIVLTSLLHILNNSIVALQLYTFGESVEDISYSEWLGGDTNTYLLLLLCTALSIVLMKLFWDCYLPDKKQ